VIFYVKFRTDCIAGILACIKDFQNRQLVVYGKGGKERTVYLTPVAAMYLEKYLQTRKDNNKALFTGKGSNRLKKNGIEVPIKRLGERAGVESVRPLRGSLAAGLIARRATLQDV